MLLAESEEPFVFTFKVRVPVFGNKGSGEVYIWGRCLDVDAGQWIVQRLDMLVHRTGQKWKFYEAEPVEMPEEKADRKEEFQEGKEEETRAVSVQKTNSPRSDDPLFWIKLKDADR